MNYYAGIDVSLECSSVCVVDGTGKIAREAKVASEPEALIAWFGSLGLSLERIGLEAGPLSQWLYAALREAGLAVELLETRHVKAALSAMPVKTDRNDARGIAQLMRLGWFRPVHCKSAEAQEIRALLAARKLVQSEALRRGDEPAWHSARLWPQGRAHDAEALCRTDPGAVAGHATLEVVGAALLSVHAVLLRELNGFEKRVRAIAVRRDAVFDFDVDAGVGAIVGLTYISAIDDPGTIEVIQSRWERILG